MGKMKDDDFIVKTIVTTELIKSCQTRITSKCWIAIPDSSGLHVKSVCVKANSNTSEVVKKATDS